MPMGYKTRANADIDLALLAKHLVGLPEGPSHPGDNKPTRHLSLSPSPPSHREQKSDWERSRLSRVSPRDPCLAAPSSPPPAAGAAAAPHPHP